MSTKLYLTIFFTIVLLSFNFFSRLNQTIAFARVVPLKFLENKDLVNSKIKSSLLKNPYIISLLPNPIGNDNGKTEIFIWNPNQQKFQFSNWEILTSDEKYKFPIDYMLNIGTSKILKINNKNIELNNFKEQIVLVDDMGRKIQQITYNKTFEGVHLKLNQLNGLFEYPIYEKNRTILLPKSNSSPVVLDSTNINSSTISVDIGDTIIIPTKRLNHTQNIKKNSNQKIGLIILISAAIIISLLIISRRKIF